MALKDLFRGATSKGKGRAATKAQRVSVNDLIAVGKLDEAREFLEKRVRSHPRQHHTKLKLADLLMKQGRGADAVDTYLEVADGYANDGFYDKAHALLSKLTRLLPDEQRIFKKLKRLGRAQELDRRRDLVTDAVTKGGRVKMSSFAVQHMWPSIAKCSLVEELTPDQVTRFFSQVDVVKVDEGEHLVSAGADRHEMFIIVQGEVAAQILLATGKRTDLRTYSSGDIIGENALLKKKSWPASYLAKRRTSMFRLDRRRLEALLLGETDPRGLLDALRTQKHDDDLDQALSQLTQVE